MAKTFGTDGVRGLANHAPLTPQWISNLGVLVGRWLDQHGIEGPVLIGQDPRRSSPMVQAALEAGLASAGRDSLRLGVIPTPAVSLLLPRHKGSLGVVISASHNPAADNGIKFFQASGEKVDPSFEADLEADLDLDLSEFQASKTGSQLGELRELSQAEDEYVEILLEKFRDLDLTGKKVAFDGAHGASARTSVRVLEGLGAQVTAFGCEPNGDNINEGCGALHPDFLAQKMSEGSFDFGLLQDGDGDRGHLMTAQGQLLDGEDYLYILTHGACQTPTNVVGTVMCNLGLETALAKLGAKLHRAQVGDRNVKAEMDRTEAPFGAEPSGHVIVRDLGPTGDGLASSLAVLQAVQGRVEALAKLAGAWTRAPQAKANLKVREKPPLEEIPGFSALQEELEAEMAGKGRILVRYSGTEPKVRVLVEAEEASMADSVRDRLQSALEGSIGLGAG